MLLYSIMSPQSPQSSSSMHSLAMRQADVRRACGIESIHARGNGCCALCCAVAVVRCLSDFMFITFTSIRFGCDAADGGSEFVGKGGEFSA